MNVNGISGLTAATEAAAYSTQKNAHDKKDTKNTMTDVGAVYEASDSKATKKTYTTDAETVAKLKADADEKTAQFRQLVEKLFSQQAGTSDIADSIWRKFASGNFTADAETIKQAQADIAEDGYWGVEQTSDRIFSFAKALSGGDPDKMDKMLEAFKKGYEQATKAWGQKLPDISSRTYDAVMKKFEDYKNAGSTEE